MPQREELDISDPSVFSTESNREGIQVGTAIATLIRRSRREEAQNNTGPLACPEGAMEISRGQASATSAAPGARAKMKSRPGGAAEPVKTAKISGVPAGTQSVAGLSPGAADAGASLPPANFQQPAGLAKSEIHFRHLWGKEKRAELLKTLNEPPKNIYTRLKPPLEVGLPFLPMKTESGYYKWPLLTELFPISFPGVKTSRDEFLVDMEKDALVERLEKYFDPEVSHEEMKRTAPRVMEDASRFVAIPTRDYLRKRGFLAKNIVSYCYHPFDTRWLYWEPETKLLDEKRTEYFFAK